MTNLFSAPQFDPKRDLSLIVLLVVLVTGGLLIKDKFVGTPASPSSDQAAAAVVSNRPMQADQDHILLKFKNNVGQAKRAQVLAAHGLQEKSEISGIGVKIVNIPPSDTPEEVVDRLRSQEKS